MDKNEEIESLIRFQQGYWEQTINDSLLENGVNPELVKEVCREIFTEAVPKYTRDNIDTYPEKYGGLCYFVRKE